MVAERLTSLCLHGIGVPGRTLESGEVEFWLKPEQFDELLERVGRERQRFALSFDDGNLSDIEHALPRLKHFGLSATFFVVAGRLDSPGSLGRSDVRTLVRQGMTIGSHGMDHRSWRGASDEVLEVELDEARDVLEDAAGCPITVAACPYGAYDRRVLANLRRRQYEGVFTADGGRTRANAWIQARYAVRRTDTAADIGRLVRSPIYRQPTPMQLAKRVVKRWR